jgi:hypothetical protein
LDSAHEFADARPGNTAKMEEADPPVAQISGLPGGTARDQAGRAGFGGDRRARRLDLGSAVFYRLGRLAPGDRARVSWRSGFSVLFEVYAADPPLSRQRGRVRSPGVMELKLVDSGVGVGAAP